MCLNLPGPRCAPHTLRRIERYDAMLSDLHSKFQESLRLSNAESASPRRALALKRQRDALSRRIAKIEGKRAVAQMDYDGTPTGRAVLEQQLELLPVGSQERDVLVRRIRKGKMLRAWRKNAMERKFSVQYFRECVL